MHDARDQRKCACALELLLRLLRAWRGAVSTQVLQEFFAVAARWRVHNALKRRHAGRADD